MRKLILASGSPRRKALLEKAGLAFEVDVSNIPEPMDYSKDPETLAKELSFQKAQEVAKRHPDALILAADTFVVVDGKYLGKPKDRQEAEEMLLFQSGKEQKVVTGFTIIDTSNERTVTDVEVSTVWFRGIAKEHIAEYLGQNRYLDKAGAYAIQDVEDVFIEKIEGDRDSIIGLPLKKVLQVLHQNFSY